jgi:hypothetical protein
MKNFWDSCNTFFCFPHGWERSHDSSVDIATGYRLHGPGSIPGTRRFFSFPQRPDQLWDPPSLLSNGYRELFLQRSKSNRGVKMTTHLHPVLRSRIVELYLHSPICIHSIMLN